MIIALFITLQSVFFPMILHDAVQCQAAPTINTYMIGEQGISVKVDLISGCPASEIGLRVSYLDENGTLQNTGDYPIQPSVEYSIPQWQAWRIEDTVRFNVSIRVRCIHCTITTREGLHGAHLSTQSTH